jgi:hypothetical protein
MTDDSLSSTTITPPPSDEEAAAIAAALSTVPNLMWPGPAVDQAPAGPPSTRWRFSGRWWNKRTWKG